MVLLLPTYGRACWEESGSAPGEFCSGNGAQLSLVLAIVSE